MASNKTRFTYHDDKRSIKHLVTYYNYDRIRSDSWFDENGRYHRVDGPAHTEYFDTDVPCVYREDYYIHGQLHRDDGPCCRVWNLMGTLCYEQWRDHGGCVCRLRLPRH